MKLEDQVCSLKLAKQLDEETVRALGNYVEDTEADARAKMLIYLLENKLMDLKTLS